MTNNSTLKQESTPPADGPENFDLTNNERAQWALAGLVGFANATATDDCDLVADLLCDLMHLLDRMPVTYATTFDDAVRHARNNYDAEISPQRGPLANTAEPQIADKNELLSQFRALLAAGLTQADILAAVHDADPNVKAHDGTIEAARSNFAGDDIEIDDKPLLSVADAGVWVSAWVWVAIEQQDDSCDNCGETSQDGSGTCISCGQEFSEAEAT